MNKNCAFSLINELTTEIVITLIVCHLGNKRKVPGFSLHLSCEQILIHLPELEIYTYALVLYVLLNRKKVINKPCMQSFQALYLTH